MKRVTAVFPKYKFMDNKLFILNNQRQYIYVKQKLPEFIDNIDILSGYDIQYKRRLYPKCIHLHEPLIFTYTNK